MKSESAAEIIRAQSRKLGAQTDNYLIRSNRDSGFGRYDAMMIPKKAQFPAIVMEFKVKNPKKEEGKQVLIGS